MGWINGLGPYRHLIGPGWILSTTFSIGTILPRQIATSDLTWPGQRASDQSRRSWNQRPFVLVVEFHDLLTEKVVNFSLRPPAFDHLFLVKKGHKWKSMTFQWPIVRVASWHISCSVYKHVHFCGVHWVCKYTPNREDRYWKRHKL